MDAPELAGAAAAATATALAIAAYILQAVHIACMLPLGDAPRVNILTENMEELGKISAVFPTQD